MFQHILVPSDGSPRSAEAIEQAMAFARDIHAKVTVLTVVEPFHLLSANAEQLSSSMADYARHAGEAAAGHLAQAADRAEALGVVCETLVVEDEHPYEVIIATAVDHRCDLIAMASHGRRGISAVLLGSETVKVLTHSKIPVLVYR